MQGPHVGHYLVQPSIACRCRRLSERQGKAPQPQNRARSSVTHFSTPRLHIPVKGPMRYEPAGNLNFGPTTLPALPPSKQPFDSGTSSDAGFIALQEHHRGPEGIEHGRQWASLRKSSLIANPATKQFSGGVGFFTRKRIRTRRVPADEHTPSHRDITIDVELPKAGWSRFASFYGDAQTEANSLELLGHIVIREMSSGRQLAILDFKIPADQICSWIGQKAPGLHVGSPGTTCYSGKSLRALDFGVFSSSLRLLLGDVEAAESLLATHRSVSFRVAGPDVEPKAWHFAH